LEQQFKATIVWLILHGEVERALERLAQRYGVKVPTLKVGLPKRRKSKAVGCYNGKKITISVLNSDTLKDPFVILHEFYHHLRTDKEKHRGTEKYANAFAREYIEAYTDMVVQRTGND
jgi:hypothetical protein